MQSVSEAYMEQRGRVIRNPGVVRLVIGPPGDPILTYNNDKILQVNLSMHASPIAEDIPQNTFSVTVDNTDYFWDYENPDSLINTLPKKTVAELFMGYLLDDGTEEVVPCGRYYIDSVDANELEATITGKSPLVSQGTEVRGLLGVDQASSRDLDWILGQITDYLYRSGQVEVGRAAYTWKPDAAYYRMLFNQMGHGELSDVLQTIAAGTGGFLTLDRDFERDDNILTVRFRYDNIPIVADVSDNRYTQGTAPEIQTVKLTPSIAYPSFLPVDGSVWLPSDATAPTQANTNIGFVSSAVSNSNKGFSTAPRFITSTQDGIAKLVSGIYLEFGATRPTKITVYTKDSPAANWVSLGAISSGITPHMTITEPFGDGVSCEYIAIEFNTMAVAGTPATVDYARWIPAVEAGSIGEILREEMMSVPAITRKDTVKGARVPYFDIGNHIGWWFSSDTDITVSSPGDVVLSYDDLAKRGMASYDESTETLTLVSDTDALWSNINVSLDGEQLDGYSPVYVDDSAVTIPISEVGPHHIVVSHTAHRYSTGEAVTIPDGTGDILNVELPAIQDSRTAQSVARRLTHRYGGLVYRIETRGSFELDPGDIVFIETRTGAKVPAIVIDIEVSFNGGYSGSVTAQTWEI